jgi:hypothetical protein
MRRVVFILLTAAFIASGASALAVTTSESIPLDALVFVPCSASGQGEDVTLQGRLHVLDSVQINANTVHVKQQFNPQDVSGVGSVTGTKYRGTGVTEDALNFNAGPNGFPIQATFVNNFRIVGQGTAGGNLQLHENAHVTVNANGVVTTAIDNFSLTCK